MWWLRAKLLHFYSMLRGRRTEAEIEEELHFHLEMRIRENVEAGLTPSEAEREARRRFGSLLRVREESWEERRGTLFSGLAQDLRHACRGLLKNRGFTTVAVLTLALGIGANTAIFSVIDAVLLRPLPYRDPDRLAIVWEDATAVGFPRNTPAPANYADWKGGNTVFEDMAAVATQNFSLTGDGEPEQIVSQAVTANFFSLLGVTPALGRTFLAEEDSPGAARVAVLSHALWQGRYGGDPAILGRQILLSGENFTVVGVMPRHFQFLESYIKLWVPIAFDNEELTRRSSHYLTVAARLKDGVSFAQAGSEVASIMERIEKEHPEEAADLGALVVPLREEVSGSLRRPLIVLLGAVAFVLLIACANIANLFLSRAANRRKEIAVRGALGAGRVRIMRQLLVESLILAGGGAIAGLALAYWSFAFLRQLIPPGMVLGTDLRINPPVLWFTLLVAVAAGILFGLAPLHQVSRIDLKEALQQGGGRSSIGNAGGGTRQILIAAEMGLALILLIGAGLLMQSLQQLRGQYASLEADSVLTLRTTLPRDKYDHHAKRLAFYNDVLDRVKRIPTVVSAGYTTSVPLEWKGGTSGFAIEGRPEPVGMGNDANHRLVTPAYLAAMGIQIRRGRSLQESDNRESRPVLIVNEAMARQYWPGEDALGKRLKIGGVDSDKPWATIVGIAADVRQMGADVPVKAEMYFPYAQVPYYQWFAPRDLAIRTAGDPLAIVADVRAAIREVDPNQPIANMRTMAEILGGETSDRRVGTTLIAVFALLALLLASIGIYGLLSYFVAQHRPEIGVRLALGAKRGDIVGLILLRGMKPVLVGAVIGLVLALGVTKMIESLLFGVSAFDPVTFAAVSLLLLTVALLTCCVPALKASKVDPLSSIRAL